MTTKIHPMPCCYASQARGENSRKKGIRGKNTYIICLTVVYMGILFFFFRFTFFLTFYFFSFCFSLFSPFYLSFCLWGCFQSLDYMGLLAGVGFFCL